MIPAFVLQVVKLVSCYISYSSNLFSSLIPPHLLPFPLLHLHLLLHFPLLLLPYLLFLHPSLCPSRPQTTWTNSGRTSSATTPPRPGAGPTSTCVRCRSASPSRPGSTWWCPPPSSRTTRQTSSSASSLRRRLRRCEFASSVWLS